MELTLDFLKKHLIGYKEERDYIITNDLINKDVIYVLNFLINKEKINTAHSIIIPLMTLIQRFKYAIYAAKDCFRSVYFRERDLQKNSKKTINETEKFGTAEFSEINISNAITATEAVVSKMSWPRIEERDATKSAIAAAKTSLYAYKSIEATNKANNCNTNLAIPKAGFAAKIAWNDESKTSSTRSEHTTWEAAWHASWSVAFCSKHIDEPIIQNQIQQKTLKKYIEYGIQLLSDMN